MPTEPLWTEVYGRSKEGNKVQLRQFASLVQKSAGPQWCCPLFLQECPEHAGVD
jgi:hypothetical protein